MNTTVYLKYQLNSVSKGGKNLSRMRII